MIVCRELKQLTCQTNAFDKIIFNSLKLHIKVNGLVFHRIRLPWQDLTNYAYLSLGDKNCHPEFWFIATQHLPNLFYPGLLIVSVSDWKTLWNLYVCLVFKSGFVQSGNKGGIDHENTKIESHEIFLFLRVLACPVGRNDRTGVISGFRDIKRLFPIQDKV